MRGGHRDAGAGPARVGIGWHLVGAKPVDAVDAVTASTPPSLKGQRYSPRATLIAVGSGPNREDRSSVQTTRRSVAAEKVPVNPELIAVTGTREQPSEVQAAGLEWPHVRTRRA